MLVRQWKVLAFYLDFRVLFATFQSANYLQILHKTTSELWDAINDQPSNGSFFCKIESVQYYVALAITGAIRRLSREKLYQ